MFALLNFYRWDADAVRDDICDYVLDELGDRAGVVVLYVPKSWTDETAAV